MTAPQTIPVLDLQDFIDDSKNGSSRGSQSAQKSGAFAQTLGQALTEFGFFCPGQSRRRAAHYRRRLWSRRSIFRPARRNQSALRPS